MITTIFWNDQDLDLYEYFKWDYLPKTHQEFLKILEILILSEQTQILVVGGTRQDIQRVSKNYNWITLNMYKDIPDEHNEIYKNNNIHITGYSPKNNIHNTKMTAILKYLGKQEKKINIFTEDSEFIIYRPLSQIEDILDDIEDNEVNDNAEDDIIMPPDIGWYMLRNVPLDIMNEFLKTINERVMITYMIDGIDYLIAKSSVSYQKSVSYHNATSITDFALFPSEKKSMIFELVNECR